MATPDVVTSALTRRFKSLVAVDHLDLTIESGVIFGLLGPNGAGKSTTIKMLTTLLPPTSGSATVGGFDVVRRPAEARRRMGYVPQLVSADGALTGLWPRCGNRRWTWDAAMSWTLIFESSSTRSTMVIYGSSSSDGCAMV